MLTSEDHVYEHVIAPEKYVSNSRNFLRSGFLLQASGAKKVGFFFKLSGPNDRVIATLRKRRRKSKEHKDK